MKRLFACFLFTLGFVGVCSGQYYFDRIVPVKDAPFSATVQGLETGRDTSFTWTADIARASRGSVYIATYARAGDEFEGSIKSITIDDAASQCSTGISPYLSHLKPDSHGHMSRAGRGLSITLSAEAPTSPIPTVAEIRERNLQRQQCECMNPQHINPDAKMHQFSLGQRTADGMTLYGFRFEHASDSETGRVTDHTSEDWDSELGFTYSAIMTFPVDGRVSAHRVTDLKLAEPPAELFTLQDKYFPPTSIFSEARTVFVSPFNGHAELQQRITLILTASGQLTAVADPTAADLVVAVRPYTAPPDNPAPMRQILIEFQAPDRRYLMSATLRFKGASDDWAEEPVVNTCFANLWNRVESLHLSAAATGEK